MSNFSDIYQNIPVEAWLQQSLDTSERTLESILRKGRARSPADFAALISPRGANYIEELAQHSNKITQRHFGKTIRLFAPLYLSNECVNICTYCGFSRNNEIPRITIPLEQVVSETKLLANQGFRSLLLVAGEHPKYVSNGYVEQCITQCLEIMPSIAIELGPMETEGYIPLVNAGCEGLIVYQETYHEPTYKAIHPAGPKKNYAWRMNTAQRAYAAGFRRLGIGALYGFYDWRYEALSVAAHALFLLQHCWKAQLSISVLRLRPAAGSFTPSQNYLMSDKDVTQLVCAFRMLLPHANIVLSTRESPQLRNGLVRLGITTMSAGSSTEPGAYSDYDESNWSPKLEQPGEQFHIADERSPSEIATMISNQGYEPVWKDFDQSLVTSSE
jgi:2-iminoacetate synthase